MATIQTTPVPSVRRMTAAEFEKSDLRGFELDDGLLVEMNVGTESSWIGGEIFGQLWQHVRQHKLGWVFPQETAFNCFPDDADRVRKPDASFVRSGRLPEGRPPRGFCPVAPDLVVEVVSPNDGAEELDRKVTQYLSAGIQLIWVLYPETKSAHVTRLVGPPSILRNAEVLDGEGVVPGFSVSLDSLFPEPETLTA